MSGDLDVERARTTRIVTLERVMRKPSIHDQNEEVIHPDVRWHYRRLQRQRLYEISGELSSTRITIKPAGRFEPEGRSQSGGKINVVVPRGRFSRGPVLREL